MSNVLVTGGAGYIGASTCFLLHQAGFTPVVIDNLSTGFEDFVRWGPLIKANISDKDAVTSAIREHKPVATIHFAASAYVGESVRLPMKYYKNNVSESSLFLSTLIENECGNLVFSSTCATYGEASTKLISESDPQHPINPYGRSKLMIESMLQDIDKAHDFRNVSLRYFNAAGAILESGVGEKHTDETHLIPIAIESAIKNKEFEIYGDDYDTPDGTAIRDYIHVFDLGNAHINALKYLLDGGQSDNFNLGTGRGTSVLEITDGLSKLGHPVSFNFAERRPGDPPQLVANPKKANSVLNWVEKQSSTEQILRSAITWHKGRLH